MSNVISTLLSRNNYTKALGLMYCLLFMGTVAYAQPINDKPSGAINLTVTDNHNFEWYSNFIATNSNVQPQPGCGSYAGGDVWFKTVVPITGNLRVDVKATENPKYVAAIYTGTSENLSLYTCSEVGSNGQINSRIDISDIELKEKEIFIRVFRFGSSSGADFRISTYKNEGSVGNENPENAIVLDSESNSFTMQSFSSEGAASSLSEVPAPSCGSYNGYDVWFKIEVPMSGKMVIETNPGTIDPVIVAYTGTTDNLIELDCSLSGKTDSGGEIIINEPMLAGEFLHVRAFADNQAGGGTFEIVAMEITGDVSSEAIELDNISLMEEYTRYTNQYAEVVNDGIEPTCGNFKGRDIWFTVAVPSNGKLIIDTKRDDDTGIMPVISVYRGTSDNLTQYDCNFWGSGNPFGAKVSIEDSDLKNEIIYIRMYSYNQEEGGAFQMALTQPESLPVELVGFRSDVLNNESVLLSWETATEFNNDHFLIEHSLDGRNYTPVGHVAGVGTTDEMQAYHFEHEQPYFGENYYRLKQVDHDGAFEYSKTVIGIVKMEEAKVHVYPNPVVANNGMTVRWIGDFGREAAQLAITNSTGRQVFFQEVNVEYDRQSFIDLSSLGLNAGVYFLTVRDENALITHQKLNLVRD